MSLMIVAIAGGQGCRKDIVAETIKKAIELALPVCSVSIIPLSLFNKQTINIEEPAGVDLDAFAATVRKLQRREAVTLPGGLSLSCQKGRPMIIIFEGIYTLWHTIRDAFSLRVFVDVDADVRLSTRGTRYPLWSGCLLL